MKINNTSILAQFILNVLYDRDNPSISTIHEIVLKLQIVGISASLDEIEEAKLRLVDDGMLTTKAKPSEVLGWTLTEEAVRFMEDTSETLTLDSLPQKSNNPNAVVPHF